MGDITTLIQKLAGTYKSENILMLDCKVLSVDTNTRTCNVVTLGGQSSNALTVRLMATVDDGCLKIPAIDSTVVVLVGKYVEPVIILYSELDSIVWLGGEYGGVPIVSDPNDATKGILARLNNIEQKHNDLVNYCSTHNHPYLNGTTPATTSSPTTPSTNTTTSTTSNQLEHIKITH